MLYPVELRVLGEAGENSTGIGLEIQWLGVLRRFARQVFARFSAIAGLMLDFGKTKRGRWAKWRSLGLPRIGDRQDMA